MKNGIVEMNFKIGGLKSATKSTIFKKVQN